MKFNYDQETDSLYINFVNIPGTDSFEIAEDFIADVDENGNLIGLEVLNVKEKVDVKTLEFTSFPIQDIRFINKSASMSV